MEIYISFPSLTLRDVSDGSGMFTTTSTYKNSQDKQLKEHASRVSYFIKCLFVIVCSFSHSFSLVERLVFPIKLSIGGFITSSGSVPSRPVVYKLSGRNLSKTMLRR